MAKVALITGITGQDGSYLAELLLEKGYTVHGVLRRASSFNTGRIEHLYQDPHEPDARLHLHFGDLTDGSRLVTLLENIRPQEVYNLAAQSHVRVSFDEPEYTGSTTGLGSTRLLEAIRMIGLDCRYYQASSSEMFGASPPPQNERTPFWPRSPYGVSKVYAYWMARNYREAYGMFAVNGILFNHESPRRGETFVTRKITRAVAEIAAGRVTHFTSEIWMLSATGVMRRSTSRECGLCSSMTSRMTTFWPLEPRTVCGISWSLPLIMSGSTGRGTFGLTDAICGQARSTH